VAREALRQKLEAREQQLNEREAAFMEEAEISQTALARVGKREKRLAETEASMRERTRELDEREEGSTSARLATRPTSRSGSTSSRHGSRPWRARGEARREGDQLATYVAQAQGALQRRESEWWNKQIGNDDDFDAEVA
jgi:hypothetical protein